MTTVAPTPDAPSHPEPTAEALAEIAAKLPGPDSIVRRRASDPRAGAGGAGYALALQVSHPTIASGVRDHSDYVADPWGRFFRTADFVALLAYGDPATVARLAHDLRRQHATIRGTTHHGERYSALEPSAYAWVHATLGFAIVKSHDAMGTTFTPAEREQFWAEWLDLGDVLGVRRHDLPRTWATGDGPGVDDHIQTMIDTVLEDNDMVQQVKATSKHVVGTPPVRWMPRPLWNALSRPLAPTLSFLGTGMLPPELRTRFHLDWSSRDERRFRAYCRASKAAGPLLPGFVRRSAPMLVWTRQREIGPFGVRNDDKRLDRAGGRRTSEGLGR